MFSFRKAADTPNAEHLVLHALPWIMGHYESLLRWALTGWRTVHLLLGTAGLFIFSIVLSHFASNFALKVLSFARRP